MELAARQFARRVLLIHFALLCLVLLAVGLAAKFLYRSARTEVIQQAQGTQALLARQTSLGIENYYQSITGVLDLLQPPTPSTQPTSRPFRQPLQVGSRLTETQRETRMRNFEGGPFANMINRWGSIIWENSREKVSLLFIIDAIDNMNVIKVIGTSDGAPDPKEVAKEASDWLATVKTESISPFFPDLGGGANLVSVPVRAQGGVQMVAVVPISDLENHLLQFVNRSGTERAAVIDDRGVVISAATASARGKSILEKTDPRIMNLGINALKSGNGSTETFERGEMVDNVPIRPAMITVEPVDIPGGRRWLVVISSGLDEVDDLVKPIFRDALTWAIVVVLAVMAILVSTASQMIRSRRRLERAQMALINKEMSEARQIQLNWLPDQPCSMGGLDIAALNTPASHISGDFYNWFMLSDGRVAVIIGDVTGHGMSGAFLMATTQLLVRTTLPRISDPGFCMEEVNRQLCTQVFNGQFVTMLIMVFDLENNWLDICTAGHPAPMLFENGHCTSLTLEPQLVLGVDVATEYRAQRFPLTPGVGLLVYTDGVADAISPNGDRFTTERIQKSIVGPFSSASQMLASVTQSIEKFRTGCDLSDDLTMVAMQTPSAKAQIDSPKMMQQVI